MSDEPLPADTECRDYWAALFALAEALALDRRQREYEARKGNTDAQ